MWGLIQVHLQIYVVQGKGRIDLMYIGEIKVGLLVDNLQYWCGLDG